ncbi:MAG: type I restriction endonuclease [Burkholderiaceae bacterium]
MEEFKRRVLAHTDHIRNVGIYCTTEETTKQALILPLLDILGFSAYDPTKVRAEYFSDFPGVKSGERVDYALFCNGLPVMFIEAKAYNQNLTNHCPQLSRYYNATPEVTVAAITNGREWRFFTDLDNKNIMDAEPFLRIHFDDSSEDAAQQLHRFHHDQFQPDALRALAEESIYLAAFKTALTSMLQECDIDFVKYIAGRANIQRTFTTRFLESVQPIVKQALAESISGMVATSLSTAKKEEELLPVIEIIDDPDKPLVDPNNPKIITTSQERKIMTICCDVLPGEDLHEKDTESYFAVLYQGKSNRWIVRYMGDKRQPKIQFGLPLSDSHKSEIRRAGMQLGTGDTIILEKPDNLFRLAGLLSDALAYCKDDENFKRKTEV